MNKKQAINKMNKLGAIKSPFLFIIDFDMNENIVLSENEIDKNQIQYYFNGKTNSDKIIIDKKIYLEPLQMSLKNYEKSFDVVKKNILKGNSYLINLTTQTEVKTNLNLFEIFILSKAKYKIWIKDRFAFFSPEIFVKIKNGKIYSFPMKGTIDAEKNNAKKIILNNKKELAEHYTIVDLIRNDLNIVAENVKVDKFRYVDFVRTHKKSLYQVSSQISGDLSKYYSNKIGDILFSLLPAGSITGAPKKMTVDIIKKAENYKRGFYTGISGFFDGYNLDSCVNIRFVEKHQKKYFYKSGGGITNMSNLNYEFNELKDKIYIPF